MPFWKKSSPEDAQRRLQEQQDDEASQRSLESGGLPVKAQRRLHEEMIAGHPLFTSDLSSKELTLTSGLGYRPLSQVMGSSIYQVVWQYTRRYTAQPAMSELNMVSGAHQQAALLALNRLQQEATLVKADGVIGVRFTARDYEWGSNMIEYTAIGTAIRVNDAPPHNGLPFLSDLSGQEFWTLLQAGYYPLGIVTGYCSYYVSLGSNLTQSMKNWFSGGWTNQEVVPFSQGTVNARHFAMNRVVDMARKLNAYGVVGMHIENTRQVFEYEREISEYSKYYYMDLAIHFSAVGTAITAQRKDHVIPSPKPTLTFTDLRPGRYGQSQELRLE